MNTPEHLIVVLAFDRDEDGDLVRVGDSVEFDVEAEAIANAREMAKIYDGVVVWRRDLLPGSDEHGPMRLLFTAGDVPKMG